ncbi:MAG: EamA family transporter [Acidobacteria bacterium]|nr:MAG: EamA family transporter [Acidobacteriota bacterium]
MTEAQRQQRWMVILAFGLVYLFWGSTYLGIRIAVQQIPPALMCAMRFLIAGVFILAFCGLSGRTIVYPPRQLGQMAVIGVLLLVGGNLTLSYAERYVPSGLSALILAVTPLWFLVLDSLLIGHHRISRRGLAGLGLGIAGIVILLWPDLTMAGTLASTHLWSSLSLLLSSFTWALGSVLSKRWQSVADPFSAAGWETTFAGVGNLLFAVIAGDFSRVIWGVRGISATLYLVVCGSWIGYTAYIFLLQHVPTSKVSTYAYVNPVVAVFLGWLILHERVDLHILAGSVIVIASVILVTSAKVKTRTANEQFAAAETVAD